MVMGNPEAPIKLEEFGAFTCGHCAQFTKDSHEELKRDFIDTGRVSYKLTPSMLHPVDAIAGAIVRSEEHTSELQSLMRISYAVFCLKKNNNLYALKCHVYESKLDNVHQLGVSATLLQSFKQSK